jgi:hypothetical protein
LSDTRTPTDASVTPAKIDTNVAHTFVAQNWTANGTLTAKSQLLVDGGTGGSTATISINHYAGGITGQIFLNKNLDSASGNQVRLWNSDTTTGGAASGILTIANYNTDVATFGGTDGGNEDTYLKLRYHAGGVNKGVSRVTVGAVDSGGTGFRVLRVPN